MDKEIEKIDCKLWRNDYYQGLGDDRMFDYRDRVILRYGKLIGYRKLPKDRHELRMEIHRITSLLARRTVGEASKKNLSGIVVTRFNDEADTEILALIPDELPKEKPAFKGKKIECPKCANPMVLVVGKGYYCPLCLEFGAEKPPFSVGFVDE